MVNKDKILFVVDSLNKGSGVTSVVMNLFRNGNRKYDFLILFNNKPVNFENEVLKKGANVYKTQKNKNFNLLSFIINAMGIAKKHANNYNIVHIHSIQFSVFIFIFFKIYNRKIKFIVHSHNAKIGDSLIKSVRNFLFIYPIRFLFKNKIACSLEAYKGAFGSVKNKKTIIIHNAIDYDRFSKYKNVRNNRKDKYDIGTDQIVIGHIGRFDLQKNHIFILDVFKEVLKVNSNYVLCLAGEGPLKEKIIKKSLTLGINNKIIMLTPTTQVEDYYAIFDIFLFPSLFEGLPLTMQEAQASGLKCIVSDSISKEGLLDQICNIISLKKTSAYWAQEILALQLSKRDYFSELYKNKGIRLSNEINKLELFYNSI